MTLALHLTLTSFYSIKKYPPKIRINKTVTMIIMMDVMMEVDDDGDG